MSAIVFSFLFSLFIFSVIFLLFVYRYSFRLFPFSAEGLTLLVVFCRRRVSPAAVGCRRAAALLTFNLYLLTNHLSQIPLIVADFPSTFCAR